MHTYEVEITNLGNMTTNRPFILTTQTVRACDPYTACMRALANFVRPSKYDDDPLYNFRKDHLVVSRITQKAEDTTIFTREP